MVIYLPAQAAEDTPLLDELTPREIVRELDKYVIGQADAKRAVAIALRNRIRRQKLDPEMAEEVMPKNILMIGPTGVGKTELARRLAKLANSPFLKVEASKFTEVGYVGRDVESMIRDLVEISIDMVREERLAEVEDRAERNAEERLLDLLMPAQPEESESAERTREKLRERLRAGKLDDRMVEIDVRERGPSFEVTTASGIEEMDINLKDMLPGLFAGRTRKRKMRVGEAIDYLVQEEEQKLVDMDQVTRIAIERVERSGIIFLDEVDKIAGREGGHGPDVSREGVQRDILPIVEGTTVNTRYGFVRTDHILFIAAGAFHVSKPSDLIPELQGRFPIRVELKSLTEADFIRILKEPKNALIKQYQALLDTEGIKLTFTEDALEEIAAFAARVNEIHREYRRAPPAYDSRETARRRLLRRSGSEEEERESRRRLRAQATGGHRQGSGPQPVYSVKLGLLVVAGGGACCPPAAMSARRMPPTLDIPVTITDFRAWEYGDNIEVRVHLAGQDHGKSDADERSLHRASHRRKLCAESKLVALPVTKPGPVTDRIAGARLDRQDHRAGRARHRTQGKAVGLVESRVARRDPAAGAALHAEAAERRARRGADLDRDGSALSHLPRRSRWAAATARRFRRPAVSGRHDHLRDALSLSGAGHRRREPVERGLAEAAEITPVDTFAPAVPEGLSAVPTPQSIELTWTRNTEPDFRGYNIFRSVDNGPFEKYASLVEAPTFSDSKIEAGKKYRYTVSAVDLTGNESAQSAPAEATAQ